MEYATRGGFRGFGPQNPSGGFEEQTTRGGIEELALRLSYLMKGAVAVGSMSCQIGLEYPCGYQVRSKISRSICGMCNIPDK
jgi:hypothetical protein